MVGTIKVIFHASISEALNGIKELNINVNNVSELLKVLAEINEKAKYLLLDEKGDLRPIINIFVNGRNIRALRGKFTALKDGDVVHIIPAIAGG